MKQLICGSESSGCRSHGFLFHSNAEHSLASFSRVLDFGLIRPIA
jgi:hypothetical protein